MLENHLCHRRAVYLDAEQLKTSRSLATSSEPDRTPSRLALSISVGDHCITSSFCSIELLASTAAKAVKSNCWSSPRRWTGWVAGCKAPVRCLTLRIATDQRETKNPRLPGDSDRAHYLPQRHSPRRNGESKSAYFACFVNAHSENHVKFD